MSADDNIKTIQTVYEAFGRGDVPAILEAVTDDVDWASEASSKGAPWFGVHHGKDGVQAFFEAFGSAMEVEQFEPYTFAANDTEVHTVVRYTAKRRANGKSASMELHHLFRFDGDKISLYRGSEDTAQTEALFRD